MIDIGKLCDELNERCAYLEKQLSEYENKVIPKYSWGDKLFVADIKNNKVVDFEVDEASIDRFGVTYREFRSESEFYQFPESLCFETKEDAENYLNNYKERK